jgi:hypothetical protein
VLQPQNLQLKRDALPGASQDLKACEHGFSERWPASRHLVSCLINNERSERAQVLTVLQSSVFLDATFIVLTD